MRVAAPPEMAMFEAALETELLRSGFTVDEVDPNPMLTLRLVGDGNQTAGSNAAGSSASVQRIVRVTATREGQLVADFEVAGSYVVTAARSEAHTIHQRVAESDRQLMQYLVGEIVNRTVSLVTQP